MVAAKVEISTLFVRSSQQISCRVLYKCSILQLNRFASCFEDDSILMQDISLTKASCKMKSVSRILASQYMLRVHFSSVVGNTDLRHPHVALEMAGRCVFSVTAFDLKSIQNQARSLSSKYN